MPFSEVIDLICFWFVLQLVTGLEMLLTKCHEWETNAHKGVSISEDIQALSRLILRWRTLELDCWKLCLDSVEKQAAATAAKYWFHLYSTVTSLLNDPQADLTAVQSTVRQFMSSSTLGQYETRLRMMGAFTRHVAQSGENGPLLRLFWHALLFYEQLHPLVVKRKAALRQPIEKKVRDFVKIMRWNDINYYALKEAVHRAHSTLHKLMKEWRELLEQPATDSLSDAGADSAAAVAAAAFAAVPVDPFISTTRSLMGDFEPFAAHSVLPRLPSLYARSLQLCQQALAKCPFEKRIRDVDDLVGTVITTVDELQGLKVISAGADKEKQKREAKAISMRKRKSLFQLFRSLQDLGISYRKGAFLWNKEPGKPLEAIETIVPILEVDAVLEHLPQRPSHSAIRQAWNRCRLYYSRCVARLSTTAGLLAKPSDELGPAVIERLKGFAAQFMVTVQEQWKHCSSTLERLVCLRLLVSQLAGANSTVPESSVVASNFALLWQLVVDAIASLDEFELLMKACPSVQTGCQVFQLPGSTPLTPDGASNLLTLRSKLAGKLHAVQQDLDKHFHLFRISSSSLWLFSTDQWACITDSFKALKDCQTLLDEMVSKAGSQSFGTVLVCLKERFTSTVNTLDASTAQLKPIESVRDPKQIDRLCQSVLHGVQEIYKKHCGATEEVKETEDGGEDFEENHLTCKLMAEMVADLSKLLKLETTTSELSRCVTMAIAGQLDPQLLSQCAPLFDQYVNVVEFYFTMQLSTLRSSAKLLSVLLNVFNQLLEKGFCLPAEEDDSKEGGAGTKFEENESGGLGEGEGAKDVSDQIEDEDQLDTARQQGQQEEEGPKDNQNGPKEEENGIEMSEDFDAQLQDREKKKGEEGEESGSEDEEDEEQFDKEMGDTGEGADQLEEKLWGSDEEEEDNDDDLDQDEGRGDGQKGESQLTAKQGDEQDDDNESENDKGQEKRKDKPKPLDENDDEENINDDQIDPYHTSHDPPPEPEPLDMPDELNLDGGDPKDKDDGGGDGPDEEEKNPFDIDAMKNDEAPLNEEEMKDGDDGKEEGDAEGENPDQKEEGESIDAPFEAKEENPAPADEEESGGEEGKDKEKEEAAEGDNPQPAEQTDYVPSKDKPSEEEAQPAAADSVKGSQDKTAPQETADNKPEEEGGQNQEAENDDTEGVGMAESRQAQGHDGQEKSRVNRKAIKKDEEEESAGKGKPRKPGQSDPNRALADNRKERVLQVGIDS